MLLERGSLEGDWIIHLCIKPFKYQMYAKKTPQRNRWRAHWEPNTTYLRGIILTGVAKQTSITFIVFKKLKHHYHNKEMLIVAHFVESNKCKGSWVITKYQ